MNQRQYNRMRTLQAIEYGLDEGVPIADEELAEKENLELLYKNSGKVFDWTNDDDAAVAEIYRLQQENESLKKGLAELKSISKFG